MYNQKALSDTARKNFHDMQLVPSTLDKKKDKHRRQCIEGHDVDKIKKRFKLPATFSGHSWGYMPMFEINFTVTNNF